MGRERERAGMLDRDNLALARRMSQEMEEDGTWAQLRREVARQLPDRNFERRFIMVNAEGTPAPALMLRHEPWTEETAEHWMAYLWEQQRVGGFAVQMTRREESDGKGRMTLQVTGDNRGGVSLMFIVDLESGHAWCGAPERVPEEAAALALQHYTAVMAPPGAVELGEFQVIEEPEEREP